MKTFSPIVPWLSTLNLLMVLSTYQLKTSALAVAWISESQLLSIHSAFFFTPVNISPMQTQSLCSILTEKNNPLSSKATNQWHSYVPLYEAVAEFLHKDYQRHLGN